MARSYNIFPHLVQESPWPLFASVSAFCFTGGGAVWWNYGMPYLGVLGFACTLWFSYEWWSNIIFEKSSGEHTFGVVRGLRMGMVLFIVSEVMFFFSFFWAFFGNCFNPEGEIGFLWPPQLFDHMMVDPFSMPLLKSVLLLSSGATITASHHFLLGGFFKASRNFLLLTVLLGVVFLGFQIFEYAHSLMSVKSTVYGTTFFLLTGFHGFHVLLGVTLLIVCLLRSESQKVSNHQHTGFEASSWYWHFVDVVWLFLYFFVYWYGFSL